MQNTNTPGRSVGRGLAAVLGCAMVIATPALAATASAAPVADDLVGPRGLTFNAGMMVVSEQDGTFSKVNRRTGKVTELGKVPSEGIAPALSAKKGKLFILTGGGEKAGAATLYRYSFKTDRKVKLADIGRYQKSDPDPFDLEGAPKTSNPFGVAALGDGGALVADAEGNELLRVTKRGTVHTVARLKPRTVKSPDLGAEGPPAGTPMPSEAVATSVTVGSDGNWYVGELRGFPATPGKSQIWRIKPGTKNAVCNPERPQRGACKRHADGFTSIVGLGAGPNGRLYVVELAKKSWLMAEQGATAGAVKQLNRNGEDRHQLKAGRWNVPGNVATDRSGRVYVANWSVGHFFGKTGTVKRAK